MQGDAAFFMLENLKGYYTYMWKECVNDVQIKVAKVCAAARLEILSKQFNPEHEIVNIVFDDLVNENARLFQQFYFCCIF